MTTVLNPYINFKDNTRQAMQFYHAVFGGNLSTSTFKEFHASMDPAEDDLIMHATLKTDGGLTLMASDTPNRMEYHPGANISISLSGNDETELSGYYHKLAAGGMETMPLEKAPWGDTFGQCTDKFGINWLVNISPNPAA